jgi:hypothetical protein
VTANLSVFGEAVIGSDVETAAITTLKLWLPTYLREFERRTGREPNVLQAPRSWSTAAEFFQEQGAALPAAIVVSPGTVDTPERHGDGSYSAWWRLELAILLTAKDKPSANELAKLYAAAVRMILVQKPSLGGVASAVEWEGDQYTDAPADFTQIGAIGAGAFNVLVRGVVTDSAGPMEPDPDPAPLRQVATVQTTVERIEL